MITREIWEGLTPEQRTERLTEALTELHDIDHGIHALHGKPEQGRLAFVKKDLEQLVLNYIEWETPTNEENRPSA